MTTYYNINPKFYVSVDCIIFGFDEGELKLLLLKRNFEPAMGKWSLMGGFVNEYDRELVQQHNAHWTKIDELPQLIFDHPIMISKARELMKHKASYNPIGFNLLPELFTLTQLQNLYEAIYGEPMDKRNFRKRVAEMDFIEKTDLIDKSGSRRGAYLYKFNDKAYRKDPKFKL